MASQSRKQPLPRRFHITGQDQSSLLSHPLNLRLVHCTIRIYVRRRCVPLLNRTYFSGMKLRWMLDNVPAVADGAANGTALFGTIESWLIWNLSGGIKGGIHVSDVSNASRTMLMDLASCTWHEETCATLGIPMAMLP